METQDDSVWDYVVSTLNTLCQDSADACLVTTLIQRQLVTTHHPSFDLHNSREAFGHGICTRMSVAEGLILYFAASLLFTPTSAVSAPTLPV